MPTPAGARINHLGGFQTFWNHPAETCDTCKTGRNSNILQSTVHYHSSIPVNFETQSELHCYITFAIDLKPSSAPFTLPGYPGLFSATSPSSDVIERTWSDESFTESRHCRLGQTPADCTSRLSFRLPGLVSAAICLHPGHYEQESTSHLQTAILYSVTSSVRRSHNLLTA